MTSISIAAIVIYLLYWFYKRHTVRLAHDTMIEVKSLELELSLLMDRARKELPEAQLIALTNDLRDVKAVESYMLEQGVSGLRSRQIILQGAVTSLYNHLHLNEIMPG